MTSANGQQNRKISNAIGAGRKGRFRTLTMFRMTGKISGAHVERRISAANKDAAIGEAHAVGMRVEKCTPITST